ncbi:MAG: SpoIIE family protein phosphatase [Halobacteriovoraceae bacterium]|jgi:phosphoserine phosphatase RsbU/P|nr:SpoIIE family protein phosphatase [Halobacteriovoraceae bacterium]
MKLISLPIKFKLMALMGALVICSIVFYLFMALDLFRKDKSAYIYENGINNVVSLSEQVRLVLGHNFQDLQVMLNDFGSKSEESIIPKIMKSQNNIIEIIVLNSKGEIQLEVLSDVVLERNELKSDHFEKLRLTEGFNLALLKTKVNTISHIPSSVGGVDHFLLGLYDKPSGLSIFGRVHSLEIINIFGRSKIYENFLMGSSGDVLAHKNSEKKDQAYSLVEEKYIQKIIQENQVLGMQELKNQQGDELLVAFNYLENYEMYVISQIFKEKAFLSAKFLINKSLYAAVFILSIVMFFVILFARSFSKPIEILSNATLRLAEGDFSTQVNLNRSDELGVLSKSFNFMSNKILAYMDEVKEKVELEKELEVAQLVQNSFFPPNNISFRGISLSTYYKPASSCGGDWWSYIPFNNKLIVLIGDATGHGVPSALITANVNAIRNNLKEMANTSPQLLSSAATILSLMNKSVCHAGTDILMTFFVAILDTDDMTITYSNAGHNPPIKLRKTDSKPKKSDLVPLLDGNNLRLGVKATTVYSDVKITYEVGDALILFTDGITEGKDQQDQEWGNRRFQRSLMKHFSLSAQDYCENIREDAFKFFNGQEPDDDISLTILKIEHEASKDVLMYCGELSNLSNRFELEYKQKGISVVCENSASIYDMDWIHINSKSLKDEFTHQALVLQPTKCILFSEEENKNNMQSLSDYPISHIIGYNSSLLEEEVKMIINSKEKGFSVLKSLNSACLKTWSISSSVEIKQYEEKTLQLLPDGISNNVKEQILLTLNELLTNAVFNAPLNENGIAKYRSTDRREKIDLLKKEEISLKISKGNNFLVISVIDFFGGLSRDRLTAAIQRGYTSGKSEQKQGGAGLGLFMAFQAASQVIVKNETGVKTEVHILFEFLERYKKNRERIKSFHYFEG